MQYLQLDGTIYIDYTLEEEMVFKNILSFTWFNNSDCLQKEKNRKL